MLISERHQKILNFVNKEKFVSVTKLLENFYISEATIRRDLAVLENKGLLTRTRGGAMAIESSSSEKSILLREQLLIKEKRMIAQTALPFFKDGRSFFIDPSTTVGQLIPLLAPYKNITVITNGISNALLLSSYNHQTILVGGHVSARTNSTLGSTTVTEIQNFHCDVFVFSCSGLSIDNGLTEINMEQSIAKQNMLSHSKLHILLADHTKFNQTFTAKTCDLSQIDILVTNRMPPNNYLTYFQEHNVKCLYPNQA